MSDRIRLYDDLGDDIDFYVDDTYDYEPIPSFYEIANEDWMFMYGLAKKYYEKNNDLNITTTFKTYDGVNYDENGYSLGTWIKNQRVAYRNRGLTKEQRKNKVRSLSDFKLERLLEIGMSFEPIFQSWDFMYDLAKKYYENHKNLVIPSRFKTFDGVTHDDNGYSLGLGFKLKE